MPVNRPFPRRVALVLALLAALAAPAPAGAVASPAPVPRLASPSAAAADVLAAINATRQAHGLKALRVASGLVRAARVHAGAMASSGFFSHSSRDGTSPAARIRRYYRGSLVGETMLWRSPGVSADQALQMWLDSPPHRKILMSRSFREIGIGIVHSESAPGAFGGMPVTIVVADFGSR
jgi:uncharacterized protein YkwD